MKKNILALIVVFILTLINITGSAFEKHNFKKENPSHKNKKVKLFNFQNRTNNISGANEFAANSASMLLDKNELARARNSSDENIVLAIPVSENETIELELSRSFPLSDNFSLLKRSSAGESIVNHNHGTHYQGYIKGRKKSFASVSLFENFVMGILSDEKGNYVLGPVKNSDKTYSGNYIFYNDADLLIKNNFMCKADDGNDKLIKPYFSEHKLTDNPARLPVKIYFEADYQTYLDFNEDIDEVGYFVEGMFNAVQTIYGMENIPTEISQISVWTDSDPYSSLNDAYDILLRFGGINQDDFQGNLAHLISTRNEGLGGIAWIRVLCSQYNRADSSGRFAFSNIEADYENFPLYSWTVNVVTHEMGHSLGSRHTQSCVWPIGGGIKAIDSCWYAEGTCFTNIQPTVGTIMSYCHLWAPQNGGGVDLALGFGPLPGDTIRLRYAQAHCLDRELNSSESPSTFDLSQNFPNPFNPVTKIRFALPEESYVSLKVYDVRGRLITELAKNELHQKGFYSLNFDASLYSLPSGIYFYQLESLPVNYDSEKFLETKKMVMVK